MLRVLFFISSLLMACSKDKPAPAAPAGKAMATLEAPVAPTNLRFEAVTDSSCRVLWDAVEGATDYDVNYKPAVGGRWTNEPHKGVRLYNTIYDLEPNTEYRWAARAENRDGASEWVFGPNFTTQADGTFDIELTFLEPSDYPFTDEEKQLIREAADFWEQVIVGDVPDYQLTEQDKLLLGGHGRFPSIGSTRDIPLHIDDLRIYVRRSGGEGNFIPPCNGLNLRVYGLPSVAQIEVGYFLNEYGYFGSSSYRRSPDIYWSEDRFVWQTAHEIGHAILGHPQEETPSLYYWEYLESRVKRERPRLIGIYYVGQHARQAYEEATGTLNPKGIGIELWFYGMGPAGFHGWSLHDMMSRWPPARFHWPLHQALENSLMAHRTPQDMPLDAPLEISQVTRGALIDLGYQVEGYEY